MKTKMMICAAAIVAVLGTIAAVPAHAQSEDWFNQQSQAGAAQGGTSSKQAMKEAVAYVNKTPLGKEYLRVEKEIAGGTRQKSFYSEKLRHEYEQTIYSVYDTKMAHGGTNQTWRGDNQSSGAKSAADKTGGNAHMSDKAKP